jgi:hypothetical protein
MLERAADVCAIATQKAVKQIPHKLKPTGNDKFIGLERHG